MSQERAHGAAGRRVEAQLRKEFRRYVQLFDRACDLARRVLEHSGVQPDDMQQLVCAALLGRLLRAAQAGVLLALRGLQHDSIASLRVSLEVLAYLKRCSDSKEFLDAYRKSDLVRKLKLARASQRVSSKTPEEIATYQKYEKHWKSLTDKADAKALKLEQVLSDAGMSDHYNTVYRLTSDAIHALPRILDDLAVNTDGRLSGLDFGPRTDRFVLNVVSFTEFLLDGIEHFSSVVSVEESERLSRIRRDLARAAPAWQ